MKNIKVLAILEKNVEWAALALAGLWVLWVAWTYGINKPVTIQLDGETQYSPGEVDAIVHEGQAKPLRAEREDSNWGLPKYAPPDFLGEFKLVMEPALPGPLAFTPPVYSPPQMRELVPSGLQGVEANSVLVKKLPEIPAPKMLEAITGRSTCVIPIPDPASVAAAEAAAIAAVRPAPGSTPAAAVAPTYASPPRAGVLPMNMAPTAWVDPTAGGGAATAAPAAVAPVAALNLPPNTKSEAISWVTTFANFNEKELEAAYQAAQVPTFLSHKVYLEVQLERQEVGPDGSPLGQPVRVPPLKVNAPPVALAKHATAYLDWALRPENQVRILKADFYQTLNGDSWRLPAPAGAAPAVAATPVVTPVQEMDGPGLLTHLKSLPPREQGRWRSSLTPEQKRALYLAEQEEKKRDAENKPKPAKDTSGSTNRRVREPRESRPTTPRRSRSNEHAAQDPAQLKDMFAQAAVSPWYRNDYNSGPSLADDPSYTGRANAFSGSSTYTPHTPYVRPSALTPDANGDILIWAHDDSLQEGKSYRYRLRVVVKNPVYNTNAAEKKLADVLALPESAASSWSDWSKPVSIVPAVRVQLVSNVVGKDQVRFSVFRWHGGKNIKCAKPFVVSCGDTVGGMEGDVDFSTDWMVADIRQVGQDTRVTLVNSSGTTQIRHQKTDAVDPNFREEVPAAGAGGAASPQRFVLPVDLPPSR